LHGGPGLMKAPVRLAAYGAGLVVAFGAAFGLAGVAVPDSVVTAWAKSSDSNAHGKGHSDTEEQNKEHTMSSVSASAAGYIISPLTAPSATNHYGPLSLLIVDED